MRRPFILKQQRFSVCSGLKVLRLARRARRFEQICCVFDNARYLIKSGRIMKLRARNRASTRVDGSAVPVGGRSTINGNAASSIPASASSTPTTVTTSLCKSILPSAPSATPMNITVNATKTNLPVRCPSRALEAANGRAAWFRSAPHERQ